VAMRIAYITAGAGNMYCGSCLRDNTLAAAMMKAGHDILLIPLYTPTRTDEINVSHHRVFLGGINVYLQQNYGFFRNTPPFIDRLLDFAPLLRLTTKWGISVDPARLGRLTVSMLQGAQGFQKKEIRNLVRYLADEIRPEIVNIPNSLLLGLAPAIKAELRVPICCTLQGEELFLEGLGEPYRSESLRLIREHVSDVDAFIAVSRFGAEKMKEYLGIRPEKIHLVPLGINFDGYVERQSPDLEPLAIGYLARIAPEKGLRFLCEAFRCLRTMDNIPDSRLLAAGYLGAEYKPYLSGIRRDMENWGLTGYFNYLGELTRRQKLTYLNRLAVFSVPGLYEDPKGLFLLEAMAAGVPVVQPRTGAFIEMIEQAGGGILVEPGNPQSLADAIASLLKDPDRRSSLGRNGYEGVRRHYSSSIMSERLVEVYQSLGR
jgi:glycosyltransferase involved in cell wall biosynthesis